MTWQDHSAVSASSSHHLKNGASSKNICKECREAILEALNTLGIDFEIPRRPVSLNMIRLVFKSNEGETEVAKLALIRCSSLKNESLYPKGIDYYGWTVQYKEQVIDYDLLLCGAKMAGAWRIFVFVANDLVSLPDVDIGRYNNVGKKLHLFQSLDDLETAKNHLLQRPSGRLGQIAPWEEEVNREILGGSNRYDLPTFLESGSKSSTSSLLDGA